MTSTNCGTTYLDACLSLFQRLKKSIKMYCKQEITFRETPAVNYSWEFFLLPKVLKTIFWVTIHPSRKMPNNKALTLFLITILLSPPPFFFFLLIKKYFLVQLENLAGSLHFNWAQLLPFLPLDSPLSPAVVASSLHWLCSLCIQDQVESGAAVIYIKALMLFFRQNVMEFLLPRFQVFYIWG